MQIRNHLSRFRLTALAAALLSTGIASAATNTVNTCSDDLTRSGTLRNTIASSAPGDTVDLSQLTCSVITLTTGSAPITINQAKAPSGLGLKIQGPGAGKLAISAQNQSRVFTHTGSGELVIDGLTIEQGTVYGPYTATPQKGGCIASYSALYLSNSVVTNCSVVSSGGTHAQGGGIYGVTVFLHHSTVSGNSAGPAPSGGTAYSEGGGIAVSGLLAMYESTISNNKAYGVSGNLGFGGGVFAKGGSLVASYSSVSNNVGNSAMNVSVSASASAFIKHSTFSNNKGQGLQVVNNGLFWLLNSTVSDNSGWGIFNQQSNTGSMKIYNSTIAFNRYGAYLGRYGAASFQSTIVSNSSISDIVTNGNISMSGSDNLVMTSNIASYPAGFLSTSADPLLGPLQDNGGPTLTRMLFRGSPAIGAGNNAGGTDADQRGPLYPRTSGSNNSVDIGAVQFDTIFADGFDGM